MASRLLIASFLLLFAPAPGAAQERPLFNGKDLAGWVEMGKPGAFVVREGTLVVENPQNYPNWLRTDREYENFVLRLEYMMNNWCETGILLHAPLYGSLHESGLRIHLRHDRTEEGARSTGAVYDVARPLTFANKGLKEWNALEIRMEWPVLRVKLNDTLIQDLNLELSETTRSKARRGYIGLDDLNCRVRYRNIQIQELPDTDRKWTKLYNGRDMTGWTIDGKAGWTVENDAFVGRDGDGFLYTKESYGAFEFQVYLRTSLHANGGVNYRCTDAQPRGYEIQVYSQPGATNPTGSIYGLVGATDVPCRDGEWCQMRFVSDGAYTCVWLNGRKVAESHSLAFPDTGRIALQMHSQGKIEYLQPRIRPLR